MKKAQELSLNLVVVGSLALLVLLIVSGVLIFGGGDLFTGLTSIGPDEAEVRVASFLSECQSKCNILNTFLDENEFDKEHDLPDDSNIFKYVQNYCCYYSDLDGDSVIEPGWTLGPKNSPEAEFGGEICGTNFECKVDTLIIDCTDPHLLSDSWVINYDLISVADSILSCNAP